jgi:inward rectifier potassium channel
MAGPVRASGSPRGFPRLRTVGRASSPIEDLYHTLLTLKWWQLYLAVGVAFVAANAVFALAYMASPGAIANARPGSFEDGFFFSVQTMATIGYGQMAPATRVGHVLVTIEAIIGVLAFALITGITFSKFSRPTARILFSERAVIGPRDGVPHLMFRMANYRHNTILEAQLRVVLLVEEISLEGQVMRRPLELPLVRDRNSTFILSWTAMHPIDDKSPFFGPNAIARLRERKAELFLSLTGTDETFAQTVHARCGYQLDDIVENSYFADVLTVGADGVRVIDYSRFHEVVPVTAVIRANKAAE